jgi:hypothetical protein
VTLDESIVFRASSQLSNGSPLASEIVKESKKLKEYEVYSINRCGSSAGISTGS